MHARIFQAKLLPTLNNTRTFWNRFFLVFLLVFSTIHANESFSEFAILCTKQCCLLTLEHTMPHHCLPSPLIVNTNLLCLPHPLSYDRASNFVCKYGSTTTTVLHALVVVVVATFCRTSTPFLNVFFLFFCFYLQQLMRCFCYIVFVAQIVATLLSIFAILIVVHH